MRKVVLRLQLHWAIYKTAKMIKRMDSTADREIRHEDLLPQNVESAIQIQPCAMKADNEKTIAGFFLLFLMIFAIYSITREEPSIAPNADFFAYLFLPKKHCDFIIGDLQEESHYMVERFGLSRARVWYCAQIFQSVCHFRFEMIRKLGATILCELIRAWFKHFGG